MDLSFTRLLYLERTINSQGEDYFKEVEIASSRKEDVLRLLRSIEALWSIFSWRNDSVVDELHHLRVLL